MEASYPRRCYARTVSVAVTARRDADAEREARGRALNRAFSAHLVQRTRGGLSSWNEHYERELRIEQLERELATPRTRGGDDAAGAPIHPGAKSRWRRADLETIFVRRRDLSARKLAASDELVERIRHQRISEVRARGDVREENGRLVLPDATRADGGWVILPKLSKLG
jgi:hypothetical protein